MTVFLSYSRDDAERLAPLVDDLERFGRPVWRDEKLSGGVDWWRAILERIRESDAFVLAVSDASLASEACASETEYAAAVNRQIVPVRLEDTPVTSAPASVAEILAQTHWVDYRCGDKDEAIGLIKALSQGTSGPVPDILPAEPRVPGSYVTDLLTEVDVPGELDMKDQIALFFRVKELGSRERDRAAALRLLDRLRARPELRTRVSDQIDTLYSEWGGGAIRHTAGAATIQAEWPDPSEAPSTRWRAALTNEARLTREVELSLADSEHQLAFTRDLVNNTVKLNGETVVSEWRMAMSSPWDYTFEIQDGGDVRTAAMSVNIHEGAFGDRIRGFRVIVGDHVVYTEDAA